MQATERKDMSCCGDYRAPTRPRIETAYERLMRLERRACLRFKRRYDFYKVAGVREARGEVDMWEMARLATSWAQAKVLTYKLLSAAAKEAARASHAGTVSTE